jgi:tetratricopeptide (TPR) repeat protein
MKWVLNFAAQHVRPAAGDRFGVLSLTERPDNLLMWAHYAGEHSGFLIEFDGRHAFFDQAESAEALECRLQPVKYSEQRPSVGWKGYVRALLTKSPQWAYEQEWRMVMPLEASTRRFEAAGTTVHLFDLPPECIRGLVLGCRMTSEVRGAIIELVTSDERYRHLLVQHARQDPERYALRLTGKGSIHFGHAVKAMQDGDTEAAYAAVDAAIATEPDNPDYLAARGGLRLEDDLDLARSDLERATELNPLDTQTWRLLTLAAYRQGDLKAALRAIGRAIEWQREDPELFHFRAGLKHELKRYASAVVDLDRAIELEQEDARFYARRATNRHKLDDDAGARVDIERALELAPDVARYHAMLAQLDDDAGDYAVAERGYSKAIELDPDDADFYYRRSQLHYMQGDLEAAISDLDQVIRRSAAPVQAYGVRAKLHRAMGDDEAARDDEAKVHKLEGGVHG